MVEVIDSLSRISGGLEGRSVDTKSAGIRNLKEMIPFREVVLALTIS